MLFKVNLLTGNSQALYSIDPMGTDSGKNLSVSQDGNVSYYTKLEKRQTDIILMSKN